MKVRIGNELLLLNVLVILLIAAIIFFPLNVTRIILGLPFVFFLPGYVLVAALFPKGEGIGGIERLALSLGMSIAVVPLIGLILNYTPWGIRLESVLYSTASFIFISSIIAWLRIRRLPESERFGIQLQLRVPGWGEGRWDKVLSVLLVLVILGALGTLGYIIATPKVGQTFTEFYVLGHEGKATEYLKELRVGEEVRVIVGVINHEYEIVSYRVEVRINGVKNNEVEGITLEHDEKWEEIVSFTPDRLGDDQKVEFLLYKDEEAQPYLEPLRLWLDVTE